MKSFSVVKQFKTNLWPYFLILLGLFLFYRGIFLAEGAWLVADHAEQHFPWAYHLAQQLKNSELPFWTNQIHAGFPILAEGQNGAFYPPNLFFYKFFPIRQGYAWNIGFHLLLSAFFMTAYLKKLKIGSLGILWGTAVYMFGSTLGGAYYNITSLKVLTWFPLALWILEDMMHKTSLPWPHSIGIGCVFTLQLLAGYQQYAAFAILFSGLYFLVRFFDLPHRNIRLFTIGGLALIAAVGLTVLLSWPQLVLMFELAIQSNRANPQEAFAYVGSYSPLALICLFFPSVEGFFTSKLYLGILPIFFMLVSLYYFRMHKHKSIFWLILIAFFLALGQYSPLYVGIIKLTKFYSFRTPVKFIYFAGFFLCVLSAWGLDRVMQNRASSVSFRSFKMYAGILAAVFIVSLISYGCFLIFEKQLHDLGRWLLEKMIYGKPGHPHPWSRYEEKLALYIQYGQTYLDPRNKAIWIQVVKMILSVGWIGGFLMGKFRRGIFYGGAILLLIADLNFSYSDIRGDYASYDSYLKKNGVTKYLEENLGDYRYFNYSVNPSEAPLPASKNMIYGLDSVNAYSPLVLKHYYDFFGALGGVNDSIGYQHVDDEYFITQLKNLGMLNVKMIVSDRSLKSPFLVRKFAEGNWAVYDNEYAMQKLNLISECKVISSTEKVILEMQKGEIDPARTVLLERDPFFVGVESNVEVDAIRELKRKSGHWSIEVENASDKVLLISQVYYPGWTAWVDGKDTDLYRANGILTALPLKRGRHLVVLDYKPLEGWMK